MRDAHHTAEPCGSTDSASTGELGVGIVAAVEDVGGDRGQIDRDGAFADAALLIENDMNSHRRPSVCFPRAARSTSDETAQAYGAPLGFGAATRSRHADIGPFFRLTAVN